MLNYSVDDLVKLQGEQARILNDIFSGDKVVSKAIDTSNAPVGYNLSPLITELESYFRKSNLFVNKLPRVGPANGVVGTKAEWWQVTSVINGMSSSYEGALGAENTTVTVRKEVPYKTTALTDYVTKEARIQGLGYLDEYGASVTRALRKFFQKEEFKDLFGNITVLATPDAPVCTVSAGGSISAGTYSVKVCAMTGECLLNLIKDSNQSGLTLYSYLDSTATGGQAITGRYWGVSAPSDADTATTTTANGKITVTITPTADAIAYAIFAKTGSDDYTLQMISSYSTAILTNYYTTGSTIPTLDGSADSISYDGMVPQILGSGNGLGGDNAYAQLTADETGVVEINEDLQGIWDAYGVDATDIYVAGDIRKVITAANIKSGGRYQVNQPSDLDKMVAGAIVGKYIHPSTGEYINVHTHRYLPKGSYLILTEHSDIPEIGSANLIEKHIGQDYFQWEVAKTSRRDKFEIFTRAALGMRAPMWCSFRKNIAPGLAS